MADPERHLPCKQAHVSAKLTGGSISNTLHIVTVSIPRCDRGGAGATPAAGTISSFVRKAKSRASGPQNRVTQCEPGAHVHFSSDTREPAALACLGSKRSPGQHRGIRPFHWSVAQRKSNRLITRKMLVQVGRFAAYAVRLRFGSCAIAHGVQPDRPITIAL